MVPTFVEELFLRIEERLAKLEREIGEIKMSLGVISDDLTRCETCQNEMQEIRAWFVTGRSVIIFLWGFVVTVLNILIGRWLNGTNR